MDLYGRPRRYTLRRPADTYPHKCHARDALRQAIPATTRRKCWSNALKRHIDHPSLNVENKRTLGNFLYYLEHSILLYDTIYLVSFSWFFRSFDCMFHLLMLLHLVIFLWYLVLSIVLFSPSIHHYTHAFDSYHEKCIFYGGTLTILVF
jgi:hypothetical protein